MTLHQHDDPDLFVNERLATLVPASDWQPEAEAQLASLHARRATRRARGLWWTGIAVATTIVLVAVPGARALGLRCLEACVNASSRVAQFWRADEPLANVPKRVGATVGSQVPDVAGFDAAGLPVSLSSRRGRVVVLNFWATWCPPCRAEIPVLNSLERRYGALGLDVIGVSFDDDGWAAVRPFAESLAVTYTLALGSDEVATAFDALRELPATFIVDRNGVIVARIVGAMREGQHDALIERLLR